MNAQTVILATRNKGKAREFSSLLAPFSITVTTLMDYPEIPDVEETGTTFFENARLKAEAISKATGLVAIADDSGVEADALDKAPGVYSARYSAEPGSPATDQRNVEKLLREMKGVPEKNRTGRFRCCMVAATPTGNIISADASWEGIILEEQRGQNGFGYDPVFYLPGIGLTAAEMPAEQKNSLSHRAQATALLLQQWPDFWAAWVQSKKS